MAKEPFLPQSDRPDVKLDPDKPVSSLTVRDLKTILGSAELYKFRKDKDFKEKDFKEYKECYKEISYDKFYGCN